MQPDSSVPPPTQKKFYASKRDVLIEGEHLISIVKRHFLGLVTIYLGATAVVLSFLALLILAVPEIFSTFTEEGAFFSTVVIASVIFLLAFVLMVATYIYRQSKLLLTDQSLVQITQRGLFIRKISRLSLSNVEDVTAEQRGVLANLFNYGTLVVQTGAEKKNFTFSWCPNPNRYADRIIEARQRYAQSLKEISVE